jgi:iron complex transport system substrate-binding protein
MPLNSAAAAGAASAKGVSVAWLAIVALVCAGASAGGVAAYYSFTAPGPAACPGAPSPGHLTITDDLGRCVTVPFDPSRVAVLSPNTMDSLFRLGLRSHVAAVDCSPPQYGGLSADYNTSQIALWNLTPLACVQTLPFVLEDVANATPQVVFASTIISQEAVNDIQGGLGIPVVVLQPATVGGILTDVTLLGEIFGVGAQASTLNAALTSELGNVSSVVNGSTTRPTAFVTYDPNYAPDGNISGYYTYGAGVFGTALIAAAGATSVSAGDPSPYPALPLEQLASEDPQVIVYATGEFGYNESVYADSTIWASLSAVRDDHVYGLDSNLLAEPDPTMILYGLPQLAGFFHPPS